MAVDLVFSQAPLTTPPIGLVFNESAAPSLDRQLSGAGTLPQLSGAATIANAPIEMVASGYFPLLAGTSSVRYNSDTQRPVAGTLRDAFQNGIDFETGVTDRMQDAIKVGHLNSGVYQDATPIQGVLEDRWEDATRLRGALDTKYQDGLAAGTHFDDGFQEAIRRRQGASDRYQQGLKVRNGFDGRYQDTLRRGNWAEARYQQATPYTALVASRVQMARKISGSWDALYQDAIRPRPGLWFRPPVIPSDPCYTPDTNLVFMTPWSRSASLVFLCERHGGGPDPEPGDTVIVPIRKVYMVLNSVSLRRVDGNIHIPAISMNLSLDVDSWAWSFSASLPPSAESLVQRTGAGAPVELEATVNGVAYRLLAESMSRDRTFGQSGLRIGGRGIVAALADPYTPIMNFGNANSRTAQQLAADVLTTNGVPMDWELDWQIENWNVPGGVWTHRGSYITALQNIVQAVGGYIQPVPAEKKVRALLRYPVLPRDWADITPDFELPASVTTREGIEWVDKARYNRAFVSGVNAGVQGIITLAGTGGSLSAPPVTDSLITSGVAARQRGLAILADTGRSANVSLRIPVLAETGVIPPGKFIRYVDEGVTRLGLSRSVTLDANLPEVFQTILVETRA